MKATILARSSSGESYQVEFLADDSSLKVFCHCQAGVLQQMCKHKLALLKGDAAMLFDPNQAAVLSEIHSWPQFVSLRSRIAEYESNLKEIETEMGDLKKRAKVIKTEFTRGLSSGFKLD
jgi:hypothetical protein